MLNNQVALIIVFNHNYEKNLKKLHLLYGKRFKNIYYLIPFYQGDEENVIPVYGSSYYFQGFISQSLKIIYKKHYDHYIYIADDLILNPDINENNYKELFKIGDESSFIPEYFSLDSVSSKKILDLKEVRGFDSIDNQTKFYWGHTNRALNFSLQREGLESETLLPTYEEAISRMTNHGIKIAPLKHEDILGICPEVHEKEARYCLEYPLVASYSDIVIVSAQAIKEFSFYCGVFFAQNLFVELAIPTSLLMSTKKIITEKMLQKSGKVFWLYNPVEAEGYQNLVSKYEWKLEQLMNKWPNDYLYVHPLKLSKWEHQ